MAGGDEQADMLEKNLEITKRKIAAMDKLLKHKNKLEAKNAELVTENLLKGNMLQSLRVKVLIILRSYLNINSTSLCFEQE